MLVSVDTGPFMIRNSFCLCVTLTLITFLASCNKAATPAPQTSSALQPTSAPIDPATAASFSGVVSFEGTPPAPQKIDMSADSGCKGQNKSEIVVVNDARLANVLVYVKDGLEGRSFPASTEKLKILQEGCRYVPHVAAAMVGQPVEFVDKDDTLHNIHPMPKSNAEWNQSEMPNGSFARPFTAPEIMIPIKCNQHPWMKMYLSVLSNPFFAVTGKDGSFALKGLPPGTYTIAAVHEKYGEQDLKITVGPKEDKKDIGFEFRP
jgi:plastocyanin